MSKKNKHVRGPLTPKSFTIAPKAIVVSASRLDVSRRIAVTDRQILEVYKKLVTKEFTSLSAESPVQRPLLHCYIATTEAVERFGGSIRYGWLLCPNPHGVATGKNRYARWLLTAHAVWEKDGILYETIPDNLNFKFILDPECKHLSQHECTFIDTPEDASRVEWGEPVKLQVVRIP